MNQMRNRDDEPVECRSGKALYSSICFKCQQTVIIHCEDCSQQVSGCRCTLAARAVSETN